MDALDPTRNEALSRSLSFSLSCLHAPSGVGGWHDGVQAGDDDANPVQRSVPRPRKRVRVLPSVGSNPTATATDQRKRRRDHEIVPASPWLGLSS